ncbi:MAG: type I restriction enzyme HsdR N-terminal domain-containing protein [bacterium]
MLLKLHKLNLPEYTFQFKTEGKPAIYDIIRKKYIVLTPEEWVRQNFIRYLVEDRKYPKSRIKLEHNIKVGNVSRRCDAVFFSKNMNPEILMEFKAPEIPIKTKTIFQGDVYNIELKVSLIVISNGLEHLILQPDYINGEFTQLNDIPIYSGKISF